MAGRFVMLQKKLQELESELNDVVRLPLYPAAAEQTPFDDIKDRIEFLEKIRAAEAVDSLQPPQNADKLRDIDERLARLKAAFSDWNQSRNCGFDDNDGGGGGDTQSLCSDCTQSQSKWLLHESSSRTRDVEDFSSEKSSEKDRKDAAEEKEEEEAAEEEEEEEAAGSRWSEIGKYGGAFGSGMIVGALCMLFILSFSEYLFREEEAFLMPPT